MPEKPVVLLAFANDLEGKQYLRELPQEARELREILEEAERNEMCELEVRQNAELKDITKVFQRHGRRVVIFHYGGHAGPDRLWLESATGEAQAAHARGLARYLGLQGGLQLIFLNGCSTGPQVSALLDAHVDAVVATARPIGDKVARDFSVEFYKALVAGRTLRDAFELAAAKVGIEQAGDPRDLLCGKVAFDLTKDITDDKGFPWKLSVREGAEAVKRVTLPQLAGDPLLGLPSLPPGKWLPPCPYPGLKRFTSEYAPVFFGRGREIAELYHLVTSPTGRRVILYSGPTGVGKSSVLEAGLRPRLEAEHEVKHEVAYFRREADSSLLGTLLRGLSGDPDARTSDLNQLWLDREKTSGRPLVMILDQAEEVFTLPRSPSPAHEVAELVGAIGNLFADPPRAPRGKLILGFRQEWLQKFEEAHNDARLAYERLGLTPLDHKGIVEAIEGPTLTDELRKRYRLTIEPGLPDRIATELEHDAGSALAPTLQVLLTKLWENGGGTGALFTNKDYDCLKDRGFLLKDVLDQGLKALKDWRADVVDSGFALDLLEYHTTPLGTAQTRDRADLTALYPHRADVLDECLRICERSYLLIPGDPPSVANPPLPGSIRLGHDTLAPLVLDRFRQSDYPGQRARRILESRGADWEDGKVGPVLDRADMKIVAAGKSGMRAWTKDQQRLIQASGDEGRRKRLAEEKQRVDAYLRTIGQDHRSLRPTELEELGLLAQQRSGRLQYMVFRRALANPQKAQHLSNRAEMIVIAAIQFDLKLRNRVNDLVLRTLRQKDRATARGDLVVRLACVNVGISLDSAALEVGLDFTNLACRAIVDAVDAKLIPIENGLPLLKVLAPGFAEDQRVVVGDLVERSIATATPLLLMQLSELLSVPGALTPSSAQKIHQQCLKLEISAYDPYSRWAVSRALQSGRELEPSTAVGLIERVMVLFPRNPDGLSEILRAIVAVAPRLPSTDASRLIDWALDRLKRDPFRGVFPAPATRLPIAPVMPAGPLSPSLSRVGEFARGIYGPEGPAFDVPARPADAKSPLFDTVRSFLRSIVPLHLILQGSFVPRASPVPAKPSPELPGEGDRTLDSIQLENPEKFLAMTEGIAALARRVTAEMAGGVHIDVLVERADNPLKLRGLTKARLALPKSLQEYEINTIARAAVRLTPASDAHGLSALAETLALLPRGPVEYAVHAVIRRASILITESDPSALRDLSTVFKALSPETLPKVAEEISAWAVQLIPMSQPYDLSLLGQALALLPLEPVAQAWAALASEIEASFPKVNLMELRHLADVLRILPQPNASTADRIVNRSIELICTPVDFSTASGARGEVAFESLVKSVEYITAKLAPLLSVETMIRLLKLPVCFGPISAQLRSALATRFRPSPAALFRSRWDLAAWTETQRDRFPEIRQIDELMHQGEHERKRSPHPYDRLSEEGKRDVTNREELGSRRESGAAGESRFGGKLGL